MMMTMARIPGVGLAKGLSVTLRHMLRRSVTQQYPEVKPDLPPRSRGVIALVEENCTSCMLCARECPDWCIYIDSHKETLPAPEGGRPRQRNVLDRFAIDFSLCMYCGICIEVCPFDALFWSPEFEYAEGDIRNLLHEKDQLGAWRSTVPPPPAHDPGAEPPKELTAAPRRPARPGAGDSAARTSSTGASGASSTGTSSTAASPSPRTPQDRPSRETAARPGPAGTSPAPEAERPATTDDRARRPGAPVNDQPPGTPADGPEPPAAARPTSTGAGPGADSGLGMDSGTGAHSGDAGARPSAASGAEERVSRRPAAQGQGRAPGARAPREGRMANVRSIRPPGALPQPPAANEPVTPPGADEAAPPPVSGQASAPPRAANEHVTPPGAGEAAPPVSEQATTPPPAANEDSPSGNAGTGPSTGSVDNEPEPPGPPAAEGASSTGEASSEKLSTAQGEPRPTPGSEGQTAASSPRRRRMADPRSIRPPGRLTPDETRESEEES